MVEDREIVLEIGRQHGCFFGKRMVNAETRHESIPADRLDPEARIADRQRYDRRINLAQNELLNKLDGIAVRGTDRQLGTTSL